MLLTGRSQCLETMPSGPIRQGCTKQIRPDLALLEIAQEYAIWSARQQPLQAYTLLLLGAFLWDRKDNYKGNQAVDDCIHGPKNDQRQDVGTAWPH